MRSLTVYVFGSLFIALSCSAPSLVKQRDFIKRIEKDGEVREITTIILS